MSTLLISALACVVFAVGGYFFGVDREHDAGLARQALALDEQRVQFNADAVIDMQAAVDADRARQKDAVVYRGRIDKVEELIHASPSECVVPAVRFGLLNAAIDQANNARSAEPVKLPAAAETGKR